MTLIANDNFGAVDSTCVAFFAPEIGCGAVIYTGASGMDAINRKMGGM